MDNAYECAPATSQLIPEHVTDSKSPPVAVVSRCAWTLHNFRSPLLRAIADTGTPVLAVGDGSDGLGQRVCSKNVTFHHIPVARNGAISLWRDLTMVTRLHHLFRKARPAVVHAFTIRPATFGTLAAKLAGVPVCVVTITGLGYAFTSAPRHVRLAVEQLYRLALSQADRVFFQNRDDLELFLERRLVPARKCRLVPGSGIDVRAFSSARTPGSGPRVKALMVARLLREKGVLEYLAAAELLRHHPELTFELVGGVDPRNPTSLTQAEVEARVREAGVRWVDHTEDVRPLIEDADIVVLPSYREGLPRSLLEGAAMGRPLVATDVPGCRDVVRHGVNGLLVPLGDAASLAQAVATLATDRQRLRSMGAASRDIAAAEFDVRIVIEQTFAAYEELLGKKVGDDAASAFARAQ